MWGIFETKTTRSVEPVCNECHCVSHEAYMIVNDIWRQLGYTVNDIVCWDCLMKRFRLVLGREPKASDFTRSPINALIRAVLSDKKQNAHMYIDVDSRSNSRTRIAGVLKKRNNGFPK